MTKRPGKPPRAKGRERAQRSAGSRTPRPAPAPAPESSPLAIDQAGPETTAPVDCPHFARCGGCDLLPLPYEEERERKQRVFESLVARHAELAGARVLPLLAAREPLFWRTSLKVPFAWGGTRPIAGFYEPGSHRIVDLETCAVQHPRLVDLLHRTRAHAAALGVPIFDERRHRGLLRHLVARIGAGTGEMLAGLVVRKGGHPATRALAERLWSELEGQGLVGLVENVNGGHSSAVLGPRSRTLCGRARLEERADGLVLSTSLESFAQVNERMASVLYAEVVRTLAGGGAGGGDELDGLRVADLYAGYGPIGLRLAARGARVFAIERNPAAVADGRAAAHANGLAERIEFVAGDAEHGLARLDAQGLDAVVVDPPRRGLHPSLVERLLALSFPRLVYVSCNPFTLARDLVALAPRLRTLSLRPVDLFPRVGHVEAVASLVSRT